MAGRIARRGAVTGHIDGAMFRVKFTEGRKTTGRGVGMAIGAIRTGRHMSR